MKNGVKAKIRSIEQEAIEWLSEIKTNGGARRYEFEAWYVADAAHADAYDAVLDSWEKTAQIGKTDVGRLWGASKHIRSTQSRWRMGTAALAAALVIVIGVAAAVRYFVFDGSHAVASEFASRVGELRSVVLADGSHVTLDTDTMISANFTSGLRTLRLKRGRARFDVEHDAARPFIVFGNGKSVTAHGTVFDVSNIGGRFTVALLRGSVEVRQRDATSRGYHGQFLVPGQAISLSAASVRAEPRRVNDLDTQWTTGMLIFSDTPLVDAITMANRYSTTKIYVADAAIGRLRVSGSFPTNDNNNFAAILAEGFHLSLGRNASGDTKLGYAAPP